MSYPYPNQQQGGGGGGYNPGYNPAQAAYYPGSAGSTGRYGAPTAQPPQGTSPYGQPHQAWSGAPQGGMPQGMPQGAPPGIDLNIYSWFLAVDADRSGRISNRELKHALLNGNWTTFSEDACRMMISLFDRTKQGTIDLNEFQSLWNYIQQWKAVFERYDSDRSGFIEQSELQRAIAEMGYRLSPSFFGAIIAKYDPKTKRKMSLDDFITFCVQMQLFTNSFRERDTSRSGMISINYEDFLSCVFMTKP